MVQASQTTPLNLRIKFKKVGTLQYISHLDLVRTMHKIIVRSKLPIWYTEGFNPKPKMVFAAPLSIGSESMCEFMDIRLIEKMDQVKAKELLNKNMTDEMQVLDVYYPERKFNELRWFSYEIKIDTLNPTENLAAEIENFLQGNAVLAEKKSKSGEMVKVDIRPLIKSVESRFDGKIITIKALLSADQSAFLNPELVIKSLKERFGILSSANLMSEHYSIMRCEAYDSSMNIFS